MLPVGVASWAKAREALRKRRLRSAENGREGIVRKGFVGLVGLIEEFVFLLVLLAVRR